MSGEQKGSKCKFFVWVAQFMFFVQFLMTIAEKTLRVLKELPESGKKGKSEKCIDPRESSVKWPF